MKFKKIISLLLVLCLFVSIVPVASAYAMIQNGSQGADVKTLQTMLNAVANAGLSVDGICGPKTVEAIKSFQSASGLTADGICGPKTWEALEKQYNAIKKNVIQNGSKGSDVKTLQTMLNAVINANLSVDGICGTKTVAAIKAFQSANGLTADGICGAKTWAELEKQYNKKISCMNHVKGGYLFYESAHPHYNYYSCANCGEKFTDKTTTAVSSCDVCSPGCSKHKFNSENGDKCKNCSYVYSPAFTAVNKTYQAAKNGVPVRTNYYANSSKVVKTLEKGEKVKISSSFYNSVGNLWYKTSDGYYIFSNNLIESQSLTPYGDTGVVVFSKQKDSSIYLTDNFKVSEFACKDGSNEIPIDMELVGWLQQIRDHFGTAVTINSGYRSPSHNKRIGGASNSYHLYGRAADIVVRGQTPRAVAQYAASIGVRGIELNEPYGYVHIDTRDTKYWFIPLWSNGKVSGYKQVSGF